MIFRLCTSQCKPPHPPGRDIAGHLRGIFRYLTSERAAGIGDFDLFCTSSKNSGGVDRGIFHRGGLGQESLVMIRMFGNLISFIYLKAEIHQ